MRRLVLILIAAAGLAEAGCGASDAVDPAVVAKAADRTAAAGNARMVMTVRTAGQTVRGRGLIDLKGQRLTMTMQIPRAGLLEMRFIDKIMYLHLAKGLPHELSHGKSWVKLDLVKSLKSKGIDLSSLQSTTGGNPADTLQQLRGAGDVKNAGTDTVRGAKTTHYKATIDLRKAADLAPPDKRPAARQSVERLIKLYGHDTLPVEVWLDAKGRIRREAFAESIKGHTVSGTMELYGFGDRQAIVPPPSGDTADITGRIGG